jgi:hypothetical protein
MAGTGSRPKDYQIVSRGEQWLQWEGDVHVDNKNTDIEAHSNIDKHSECLARRQTQVECDQCGFDRKVHNVVHDFLGKQILCSDQHCVTKLLRHIELTLTIASS